MSWELFKIQGYQNNIGNNLKSEGNSFILLQNSFNKYVRAKSQI